MTSKAEKVGISLDQSLPPGWRMSTIGELLKVRNGYAFKSTDYREDGALLVRQSNLDGSRVSIEKAKYLPKDYLNEYEGFLIRKGDILIGMSGSIGKLCTYDRDEPALQNQRTGLLVFKDQEQKPWVWNYLPLLEKDLIKAGKGVAVLNVSASQIESFPIPIAPLDQQRRIVAEIEKQFSRLDEAVANLKRVKANLKRYKAAVLKAAVEGRLVETEASIARHEGRSYETGEQLLQRILETRRSQWKGKGRYKEPAAPNYTDLPELPEGWSVASLEQLTLSERVICYGILMPKEHVSTGVLYVKVRDLKGDKVNMKSLQRTSPEIASKYARASLKAGDILLAIRGTYGRVAEVPPELEGGNITQDTARLAVSPFMDSSYIAWFLRSQDAQNYFKRVARGVAVKGVNIADVRVCPVFHPSLPEQQRIVAEVDRRLSLLHEIEVQVDTNFQRAERLRQSILQSAFSGAIFDDTKNSQKAMV